jgi:hypothetical protein
MMLEVEFHVQGLEELVRAQLAKSDRHGSGPSFRHLARSADGLGSLGELANG